MNIGGHWLWANPSSVECPGDAEVHSFVKRLRHKAWARCGFLSKGRPKVDFSNKLGDKWTRNWDFHQLLRNIYLFLVDHGSVGFGRFEYNNFMKLPIVGFHKPCADASKLTPFSFKALLLEPDTWAARSPPPGYLVSAHFRNSKRHGARAASTVVAPKSWNASFRETSTYPETHWSILIICFWIVLPISKSWCWLQIYSDIQLVGGVDSAGTATARCCWGWHAIPGWLSGWGCERHERLE